MPSAAYTAAAGGYSKRAQWVVEIDLDRCSLNYTSAPCTASDQGDGSRCWYSFPTCQDATNFAKTTKTYRFCLNDVPWPDLSNPAYPLLKEITRVPQRVSTDTFFSYPDEISFSMLRDYDPPVPDSDKTLFNTAVVGEFWRNLLTRNRNYSGRAVRIKRGFYTSTFTLSDFEQVGPEYRLSRVEFTPGECRITAESPLAELRDRQIPWTISEDNVIQNNPLGSGATTLTVTDGSEFPDPSDYSRNSVYVEIEDTDTADEICRVTSIAGNDLTIVRAQFGTGANEHAQGKRVRHVVGFGTNSGGAVNSMDTMQDIMEWAGIAAADVDTDTFDDIRDIYWPGNDVVRVVRTQRTVARLLQELREIRGVLIFLDANAKWAASLIGRATAVASYDDDSMRNVTVVENDELRRTRVAVWYDPVEDSHRDTADFRKCVVVVDSDLETANNYNDQREKKILDPWIDPNYTVAKIRNLAWRLISRSAHGERRYRFELEIKDGVRYVGDAVDLTTRELTDEFGNKPTRPCIIVSREESGRGAIRLEAVDTNYSGRFFTWGPDTMTDSYDSATADDKRYGYWGDSDNRVGSTKEEGYKLA